MSIGTAVPKHKIKQKEVYEFMRQAHGLTGDSAQRLKALYRASAIHERYSVVPDYGTMDKSQWQLYPKSDNLLPFPDTKRRNTLYRREALPLSLAAINNCIKSNEKEEITHLITVSCTGLYAPGLDIDIVNALGLNPRTERTCINFMGCYAAITGLKTANQICKADPKAKVLLVCVELCTIHFQKEHNEDNLIANALFGDGAAAVLIGAESNIQRKTISIKDFKSAIFPQGHDEMAWDIGNNGFEMKLTTYVPDLIEHGLKALIDSLEIPSPHFFAIHPGGKRILDVASNALQIEKKEISAGFDVLKHFGNMSSPTILFVLKRLMDDLDENDQGQTIAAMAFGPGLTIETAAFQIN